MRMIWHWMTCLALTLGSSLAMAQSAAKPFVGTWKVEWQTDKQTYGALMEITVTGGSWQTATSSRANPCFGRKVPIQHDGATADSLDMTLKFSDVIPDCKNATVKLKLDDRGPWSGDAAATNCR
jgi:hypothetical protein